MPTTVIASHHGAASLILTPWRAGRLDAAAIRRAASEHGVDLVDPEGLNREVEAVVAAGLDPALAAKLASSLRSTGLTVRVVNDPHITQSARVGNALAMLFLVAILTAPLVIPAILAAINAAYLMVRGLGLPVLGAPASEGERLGERTLERLRALADELPDHVLSPILAQAEALAREAAVAPDGAGAAALRELLTDLESDREAQVVASSRSLRRELALARRAAHELG